MVALKYRVFNGTGHKLETTYGALSGQPMNTSTVAMCFKLNEDNGSDAAFFTGPSFAPVVLYYSTAENLRMYDGEDTTDGPAMDPTHGCVIIVMAKDGTNPVEWSYYRFDTDTWSHTTSSNTSNVTPAWGTTGDSQVRMMASNAADFVCAAVWSGTKLTTGQRATLSTDYAAWAALSPTTRWRGDLADPAEADIGTSVQAITASSYGTADVDSPLLEVAGSAIPGVAVGDIGAEALYAGALALTKLYAGADLIWSE